MSKVKTHQTNGSRGNRQPTGKRIQSNDSKYDPKSWKQNGENIRNI